MSSNRPDADGRGLPSLWDPTRADPMSEPGRLLYRSNLLGSDRRITNFGGGNTSAKVPDRDPLTGEVVEVLWVKGSGGDLGSMKLDGFATLYLDKLARLRSIYGGVETEDDMVGLLPHCTFGLNPRAASIDTPLHAFVPYAHVDHMHPDAVIAIAASNNSLALTERIFGDEIGWLPWKRPGFELGLWIGKFAERNPDAVGVVLQNHGLFTWAETAQACYETTLRILNRAIAWFDARMMGRPRFGGRLASPLPPPARPAAAGRLMVEIRRRIGADAPRIGHFDDSEAVLDFVGSARLGELAALGTSCPDHFLRTKIRPLVLAIDPVRPDLLDGPIAGLDGALAAFRNDYAAYYERCKRRDSPAMRDANPVVYLAPGVGMITFAKDKSTARIAGEFYRNAINVMAGATSVDAYVGLPEQEAFDIEYWLLEEAKLQRLPPAGSLTGRIALVTGAAGGIGKAVARRLLEEGAAVVLADIDSDGLATVAADLAATAGADRVRALVMDVTDEDAVGAGFDAIASDYGGLDLVVSNAGISSAAPIEDITLGDWSRNMDILSTGYFLVSRAAFRLMRRQGLGGALVFVASKNGLAASANAAAYCTAKAAEIHLARCLAVEGAEAGIRVNVVNPDAVLRDSKIWQGEWRQARAATYGLEPDQLDEHYRRRSLLKRSVYPEDIAEAVHFLASEAAAKSTGNILNVDAGNAQSFTR